jgi:hypothetical protein
MPGTSSRSGGSNRRPGECLPSDGRPEPPRKLSEAAQANFDWLLARMATEDSGAHRIDGVVIAAAAELMESQQTLADLLRDDPTNDRYLRLRLQYSQQIGRFSSFLGWTPKDRQTCPAPATAEPVENPFQSILRRMQMDSIAADLGLEPADLEHHSDPPPAGLLGSVSLFYSQNG